MSRPEVPVRAYHHGDLPAALLAAAAALIEERGVDAFSLREVARRAEVSPAAPAHHFRDSRGLLTVLAARAFADLAGALEADAITGDREARILGQGIAYVRFAIARPGRFGLMWRGALLDDMDPALDQARHRAFRTLDRLVRGEAAAPAPPGDPACAPSIACWSIVHGFATLALDGAFGRDADALLAADRVLPAVLAHLHV